MPKIADFPYTNAQVLDLAKQFPTPFHLYHEETIRNTVRGLNKAFSWCPGYKNHFAVKATPNPHIMQILKEEGRVHALLHDMKTASRKCRQSCEHDSVPHGCLLFC